MEAGLLVERRYMAASPRARVHVVPCAGHDVNAQAPAVFNRILLGALRELRIAAEAVAAPIAAAVGGRAALPA